MKMLTVEQENYLKTVLEHGGTDDYVSNKTIATALEIKPSSVTEMMNRLVKHQLLISKPYAGTKLTDEGFIYTLKIIRRHRVIEKFLIEKLNYRWDEVHAEAEVLEHHGSEQFIERLDQMMGYPKTCPHGGVIPRDGKFEEIYQQPIDDFKHGNEVILKRVVDHPLILEWLTEREIAIGDHFKKIESGIYHFKTGKEIKLNDEIEKNIFFELL